MNIELIIIGALSVVGIIATVRSVAIDGYHRIPTRRDNSML